MLYFLSLLTYDQLCGAHEFQSVVVTMSSRYVKETISSRSYHLNHDIDLIEAVQLASLGRVLHTPRLALLLFWHYRRVAIPSIRSSFPLGEPDMHSQRGLGEKTMLKSTAMASIRSANVVNCSLKYVLRSH